MRKLTNELVEIPTEEERELYFLEGDDDRFSRIGCSVVGCSVRAIASIKTTGLRVASFYAENPGECVRTEAERASLEAGLPTPYLQSPAPFLEPSQLALDPPQEARRLGFRALISKLLT